MHIFAALLAMVSLFGLANSNPVEPQDDAVVSFGAETDVNSRYIWRGIILDDRLVIQPAVSISTQHMAFSIWNNHVPQADSELPWGKELDFTLSYKRQVTGVEIETSFAYFVYPHQEDSPSTGEAAAAFSIPRGSFCVSSTHTFDVMQYPGAYFGDMQITFTHEFSPGFETEFAAIVGWASSEFYAAYVGDDRSAFRPLLAEASLTCQLTDHLYAKPHVALYHTVESSLARLTQHGVANLGITFGIEF